MDLYLKYNTGNAVYALREWECSLLSRSWGCLWACLGLLFSWNTGVFCFSARNSGSTGKTLTNLHLLTYHPTSNLGDFLSKNPSKHSFSRIGSDLATLLSLLVILETTLLVSEAAARSRYMPVSSMDLACSSKAGELLQKLVSYL